MNKVTSREKFVELARELIESGLVEEDYVFSSVIGLALELDAEGDEQLAIHISEELGVTVDSVLRWASRRQKPHRVTRATILQVIVDRFSLQDCTDDPLAVDH